MSWVRRLRVLWLATVCAVVSACGAGGQPAQGASVSVYLCEPADLLPANTVEACGAQVLLALFTPLVGYDPHTLMPVNLMAESIESADQRVWMITIKEGWTFHNGEPITAASFVDSWNFAARPERLASAYFARIEGYESVTGGTTDTMRGLRVVSDHAFEVTLTQPFSQFPLTLGFNAFLPLPRAVRDNPEAYREAPIGNGPYAMDGVWEHDQSITVKRYDAYPVEFSGPARVEFRIYADPATAYRDVQAGNLDVLVGVPIDQQGAVAQDFGDRLTTRSSSGVVFLGLPLYDPRFANPDLRRALSLAIDRQTLVERVLGGVGTAAGSVVSPAVAGSRTAMCGSCVYDPERAQELLEAAGGFEGELVVWFDNESGAGPVVEAITNGWRRTLGIEDIGFESPGYAELLEVMQQGGATGPFLVSWSMDYPSPETYLWPLYSTKGAANVFGYANPAVDQLILQGNAASSFEESLDRYREAEDLILDDAPVIPLYFDEVLTVRSERVDTVVIDAAGRVVPWTIVLHGTGGDAGGTVRRAAAAPHHPGVLRRDLPDLRARVRAARRPGSRARRQPTAQ